MTIQRLFELDRLAVEHAGRYTRPRRLYHELSRSGGRPFVSVTGPRGVGKTVLLRQLRAGSPDAVYISADTLEADEPLFDLVAALNREYGIKRVYIDEIHFNRGFPAALKQMYDFLSVEVWFTSSAALAMEHSAWDLSRRVRNCYLRAFTLGEYMHFAEGVDVARLPLSRLFGGGPPGEHLRYGYHFDRFLDGGLYPFTLESGLDLDPFRSMIEKIVSTDIPSVSPSLTHDDLTRIRKVLAFIGASPIDGVNYSSISRNTAVTKYKAEQYLELLERAFLVRRAFPAGTNVLKEPKVFLEPPYRLLYRDRDACIGELREDFFALAMAQHERPFSYAKSTRGAKTPDFLIDIDGESLVLEVGGRGKGRSQFKGIEYRRKVVLYHDSPPTPAQRSSGPERPNTRDRLPLHLIGFA